MANPYGCQHTRELAPPDAEHVLPEVMSDSVHICNQYRWPHLFIHFTLVISGGGNGISFCQIPNPGTQFLARFDDASIRSSEHPHVVFSCASDPRSPSIGISY